MTCSMHQFFTITIQHWCSSFIHKHLKHKLANWQLMQLQQIK